VLQPSASVEKRREDDRRGSGVGSAREKEAEDDRQRMEQSDHDKARGEGRQDHSPDLDPVQVPTEGLRRRGKEDTAQGKKAPDREHSCGFHEGRVLEADLKSRFFIFILVSAGRLAARSGQAKPS
jgi:hypothetical protein